MNTDAQRARNARKRAKLRAKRRGEQNMFRVRIDANVLRWCPRTDETFMVLGKKTPEIEMNYTTGWMLSTLFDVSTSELDRIKVFMDDMVFSPSFPCPKDVRLILIVQYNGQERRKIWRDADSHVAADVVAAVCSLKSKVSREALQ